MFHLNPDGSYHEAHKIAEGLGGLSVTLPWGSAFGASVAPVGDLNGDGTPGFGDRTAVTDANGYYELVNLPSPDNYDVYLYFNPNPAQEEIHFSLPATAGDQKRTIKDAINQLGSGGSTAGAQGILTAYVEVAVRCEHDTIDPSLDESLGSDPVWELNALASR